MSRGLLAAALIVLGLGACSSSQPSTSRFPAKEVGCPVQIFENAPPVPTENIGSVRARCAGDIAHDECIRELKDQACRLGADVVWGVADTPRIVGDKNEWSGRAAHTK